MLNPVSDNPSYPLSEYLEVAAAAAPRELVSRAALARIGSVSRLFGTVLGCGFECRLGHGRDDGPRRCDFSVVLRAPDLASAGLPRADGPWRAAARVRDAMASGQSPFEGDGTRLWLEFDLDGTAPDSDGCDPVAPGLCVLLDKHDRAVARARALSVIEATCDAASREALRRRIDELVSKVPPSARLHFIGAFPARTSEAVNINLTGLSGGALVDLLGELGWPGDLPHLARWLVDLGPDVDRFALSMNLHAKHGPLARLGLECFVDTSPRKSPRHARLFEKLIARGLCLEEERDALLQWYGFDQAVPGRRLGWTTLARRVAGATTPMVAAFVRVLNHVKITFEGSAAPTAKGYFGITHFAKAYEGAA